MGWGDEGSDGQTPTTLVVVEAYTYFSTLGHKFLNVILTCADSCITQLKAQGPSRTCNESKTEEEEGWGGVARVHTAGLPPHP